MLKLTEATGLIKLSVPEGVQIQFSTNIRRILGIDEKGWLYGEYGGDKQIDMAAHKWLYIHLDQLSTSSNLVDGAPSTLLAIVPAATSGGIVDVSPNNPMYKKLQNTHIHQLNVRVLDEEGREVKNRDKEGRVVTNRDKSVTAVLEIRENA